MGLHQGTISESVQTCYSTATGKDSSPAETDGKADTPGALVVAEGLVVTAGTVVLVAGTADKQLGSGTGEVMLRPGSRVLCCLGMRCLLGQTHLLLQELLLCCLALTCQRLEKAWWKQLKMSPAHLHSDE